MPTTDQSTVVNAPIADVWSRFADVWSRFDNFHDMPWAPNVITHVALLADLAKSFDR